MSKSVCDYSGNCVIYYATTNIWETVTVKSEGLLDLETANGHISRMKYNSGSVLRLVCLALLPLNIVTNPSYTKLHGSGINKLRTKATFFRATKELSEDFQ